uniref:ribonuclease H n=1 Tax=Arcella intermedia TaxID=1963864 RepID=A0A6B2LDH0_9EUKA|eukprot:TRINITY_DN280_c1_g1_i2.p1 TRINITY_DN280_c1_g1~~TRINITY_DN280_c1_g1_i2.p1  ORF type:complete len:231 (-),score=67.48 TRINITY_DN280_c1_g1_i2:15-707(-)
MLTEAQDFINGTTTTTTTATATTTTTATRTTATVTTTTSIPTKRAKTKTPSPEGKKRKTKIIDKKEERIEKKEEGEEKKETEDKIVIYTDGACPGNGTDNAVAGVGVYFGYKDPRNLSEKLGGPRQTNQRAEIMAAIRGLEKVKEYYSTSVHVEIRTDSRYVINGMTDWIHNWLKNEKKQEQVENYDLMKRLHDKRNEFKQVSWVHVAGHSGEPGNDGADALAVAGSQIH